MAGDEGYNGWKNYETWSVALIVDNDEGLYHERRELVRDAAEAARAEFDRTADRVADVEQYERWRVADVVKDWVESFAEIELEVGSTPMSFLWSQLVSAALSDVDWDEIASNWLSELADENA